MEEFGISKEQIDKAEDRASSVDGRLKFMQSRRGARIKRADKDERTDFVSGRVFDSKLEMKCFQELRSLGLDSYVVFQPRFELQPKYTRGDGVKIRAVEYRADFMLTSRKMSEGYVTKLLPGEVVIDAKGMITDKFSLSQKIFDYKMHPHVLLVVKSQKQLRDYFKAHPFRMS